MRIFKKVMNRLRHHLENDVLAVLFRFKPVTKTILFESVPDLSDNSRAVFDEMVRMGVNKDYRMVWLLRDKENAECLPIENVLYLSSEGKTFKERMRIVALKNSASCLISCNLFLLTNRKGQTSFYLGHGSPIKSVRNTYNMPKKIDHCLVAGSDMVDVISYEMRVDRNKIFALGYPRNDVLSLPGRDLRRILKKDYAKVIVWYPTFRQHSTGGNQLTQHALPIIHDQNKASALNAFAAQNNVLIVVKPHFAQDLSYIKDLNLSNILFINEELFRKNNISSYQFVKSCDALVTDYSSIYYDYTLCDKPIALIWEDYVEYEKSVGFAVDMDTYMKGAEKVYTLEDFMSFVSNVVTGIDPCAKARNEVKNLVNYSDDGQNSKRVVDYILEKLSSKEK